MERHKDSINMNYVVGPGSVALICALMGTILVGVGGEEDAVFVAFGYFLFLVAFLCGLGVITYHLIALYRVLRIVPSPSLSAGKEIAYLFIPLFNLYAAFVTYRRVTAASKEYEEHNGDTVITIDARIALAVALLLPLAIATSILSLPAASMLFVAYLCVVVELTREFALFFESALPLMHPPYEGNDQTEGLIVGGVIAAWLITFLMQNMISLVTKI